MSSFSLRRFLRDQPVAFPIILLFHLIWLVRFLYDFHAEPFPTAIWVQPLWVMGYALCWFSVCRGYRMGANLYIALAVANLLLRMLLKAPHDLNALTDALFPVDLLCCFVLLVFYRRIGKKPDASNVAS